jgi:hypothetical protein
VFSQLSKQYCLLYGIQTLPLSPMYVRLQLLLLSLLPLLLQLLSRSTSHQRACCPVHS